MGKEYWCRLREGKVSGHAADLRRWNDVNRALTEIQNEQVSIGIVRHDFVYTEFGRNGPDRYLPVLPEKIAR